MMKLFTGKQNHIFPFSILILAVIIGLNMIQFRSYREKAEEISSLFLQEEAETVQRSLEKEMNFYCSFARQAANQIAGLRTRSKIVVSPILRVYESADVFDEVSFINMNNYVTYANGQMLKVITEKDYQELAKIDYSRGAAISALPASSGAKNQVRVIAPVYENREVEGYFVGISSIRKITTSISEKTSRFNMAYYLIDADGNIIYQNPAEYDENVSDFTLLWEEDMTAEMLRKLEQGDSTNCIVYSGEEGGCRMICEPLQKTNHWGLVIAAKLEDSVLQEDKLPVLLICVILEVGLIAYLLFCAERMNRKIETAACTDGQTGAANFDCFIREAERRIEADQKIPYVIARIDIIDFSGINETFGRGRGDQILQAIVNYAGENFGSKELFARNSGDQFTALMVDMDDMDIRMRRFASEINAYADMIEIDRQILLRTGYYAVNEGRLPVRDMVDKANLARKSIYEASGSYTVNYAEL